jgi:hypothetical protein
VSPGTIDEEQYRARAGKIETQLALAKIDERATESESLDLEAVLKFAGRLLGDPAEMWRLGSLAQRQRLQRLLFPEGVTWRDGRVETVVTCKVVEYLRAMDAPGEGMVRLIADHWNQVKRWLHQVDALRQAA